MKTRKVQAPWLVRQGDLLLVRLDGEPTGRAVPRERGRIVLAEGEATGHAHVVRDRHADLIRTDGAALVLRVRGASATLTHEEHEPIVLDPASYGVIRQREYDPLTLERSRRVRD